MYRFKMDINFSFPEDTRPPIYSAMKYWGKKPHNIWFEYIKKYTPDKGVFLDPFSGSCESIIESLRAGRKTIGFDFVGTTVLLQETKPLYPFGYPYSYVINHHHQNIINFRKVLT